MLTLLFEWGRKNAHLTPYVGVLLFGLVAGIMLHQWWVRPQVPVQPPMAIGQASTAVVPPKTMDDRDALLNYIAVGKAEVARLLDEQKALKIQIQSLVTASSQSHGTGNGIVQFVYRDVPGPTVQFPGTKTTVVQQVKSATFKDWRLTFVADGDKASYSLDQKFETIVTTGKTADGKPTAAVRMFEVGPGETRTVLTSNAVYVVPEVGKKRWWFAPTIQAGGAYTTDAAGGKAPAFIAGFQWLKRGTSKAAEDSTWSVLTPVFFATDGAREPGLLPVSVNLGRIPYQPLKDIWLSPYVGFNVTNKSVGHFGFAITASF